MSYSYPDAPQPPPIGDDFEELAVSFDARPTLKRRRMPPVLRYGILAAAAIGAVVVGVVGYGLWVDHATKLEVPVPPVLDAKEGVAFSFKVPVKLRNVQPEDVRFTLKNAAPGVAIDPKTGEVTWTPTEEQGPGRVEMSVFARTERPRIREDHAALVINVAEVPQPPVIAPVENKVMKPSDTLSFKIEAKDPDVPPQPLNYRLFCSTICNAKIDAQTGDVTWTPKNPMPGTIYRFSVQVAKGGVVATQRFEVQMEHDPNAPALAAAPAPKERRVGAFDPLPLAIEGSAPPAGAMAANESDPAKGTPDKPAEANFDQELKKLYDKNGLLAATDYPAVRKFFADWTEKQSLALLKQGFGPDADDMTAWLAKQPELKEDFFAALDPRHDSVADAAGILRDLKKNFEDKFPKYANVAIAIAVTWDQPKTGIFDYAAVQKRLRAKLPADRIGHVEAFQLAVDADQYLQDKLALVPWEFLVHAVDHSTPLAERQWAAGKYLAKRQMLGRSYNDVPLDPEADGAGKLKDQDYTLANIQQLGGPSVAQADFAARVCKTLLVPAIYAAGKSAAGDDRGWVVWVEMAGLTRGSLGVSIESVGREGLERMYLGKVLDPQTALEMTDRDFELRMHAVALSPQNRRHAALLMRGYPSLCERGQLPPADRLGFVQGVLQLCPSSLEAWSALAELGKLPELRKDAAAMAFAFETALKTLAAFPDAIARVYDGLTAYQEDGAERTKLDERLLAVYEQNGRPDLASPLRLRLAEAYTKGGRQQEALVGLAATIKRFPAEAGYVPALLKKYEELADTTVGAREGLLDLYAQLLPAIPKKRGAGANPYAIEMFQRGIARFKEAGKAQAAAGFEATLAELKAMDKK